MATILAPYNTAMQLGSGFNSFTQQLCINNAVVKERSVDVPDKVKPPGQAQAVTYKTSVIDKVTDVINAMNINAAFSIKYDTFDATGKGDFINTSKVKESDISFMISVKVVNQVIYDHSLTKFDPIPEVKAENFSEVYGDSYISGFQEGGEFTAVISIKAKDRQKAASIKANAAIQFTKEKLELDADGDFGKEDRDFLEENETTVSVTWSGGGQELKKPEEDWTLETMRAAALKFPDLVARTPMRTHAILTKYSALRTFQTALKAGQSIQSLIPNFEKAGVYTTVLQEAYLDFKTIAKNLQVLAFNVSAGLEVLVESPAARQQRDQNASTSNEGKSEGADSDDEASLIAIVKDPSRASKPYDPTPAGLETARQDVRFMLNRIVSEVDVISRKPELAIDETRSPPYLAPFLFKELLPLARPVHNNTNAIDQPSNPIPQTGFQDFSGKAGTTVRF